MGRSSTAPAIPIGREARLRGLRHAFAAAGLGLGFGWSGSAAAELPQYDPFAHIGVGECAGGPCHGSARPVGDRIRQDEHTVWSRRDQHSKAYKVLLNERSKSMARNLGFAKPAHESAECLNCHSDNAAVRDGTHTLEEGVGCEACHGGAKPWLKSHYAPTRRHSENLSEGMYPTDEPLARAELCTSCHFGNRKKFVNHRMMGAGHPRLRFELDMFSVHQPPHYVVDGDYEERGKVVTESVKLWAIGQAVLVREFLGVIADPERNRDGIWPEFAVLDCYTCHHAMEERRRTARRSTGLVTHPGTPRLNDSTFLMLRNILAAVDPDAASGLRKDTRALHAAISRSRGDRAAIARRLVDLVRGAIPKLERWEVNAQSVTTIALSLIDEGLGGEYRDYPSAEQAMQAVQSLVDTLDRMQPFAESDLEEIQKGIDAMYEATADADRFRNRAFVDALEHVKRPLARDR